MAKDKSQSWVIIIFHFLNLIDYKSTIDFIYKSSIGMESTIEFNIIKE